MYLYWCRSKHWKKMSNENDTLLCQYHLTIFAKVRTACLELYIKFWKSFLGFQWQLLILYEVVESSSAHLSRAMHIKVLQSSCLFCYYYNYKCCSKCSKPHQERKGIAEHFFCSSTLTLLIKWKKLIRISVLISVQLRATQRWEMYDKIKNLSEA